MKKIGCALILVAFLGGVFLSSPLEAQGVPDFSLWNGTLWKLTTAQWGYYFSDEAVEDFAPSDGRIAYSGPQWGVISADEMGNFSINIYVRGTGGFCALLETLNISYVAGNNINFVGRYDISEPTSVASGLMFVRGKMDKDGVEIKSGTIEPLGQYVMSTDIYFPPGGDRGAARVEFRGSKVSKLGCTL